MPGVKGMNDSENEEVDQETADSEKTSNDDSESTTPSGSEDEDSSEMDEEDCDRRRTECITQMADIEKQFSHLKEQLYEERITQVMQRLEEVKNETAVEYTQPLEELKENMRIRLEVAGILKELKIVNIKHKFEAEQQACLQNFESEKALLWDSIKTELEEKIGRLEEDRNSIDITSDLWNEQVNHRKNKRKAEFQSLEKRKKPVTVSGPYIVYMLRENDILEDWTTIRKALKATKQSCEYEFSPEQRFSARFADGKLLFKGDAFRKGESVSIEEKADSSWMAHIISVNTSEVLLQKQDGSWKRIFISDLQSGKYSIRHSVA